MQLSPLFSDSLTDIRKEPSLLIPPLLGTALSIATLTLGLYLASAHARSLGPEPTPEALLAAITTPEAVAYITGGFVIGYLISLLFAAVSFAMCSVHLKGDKPTLKRTVRESAGPGLRYVGMRLLIRLLILIPTILLFIPSVWLAMNEQVLAAVLAGITAVLATIAWTVFVELRFMLGAPELFLKSNRVSKSLRNSYSETGKALGAAILVGLILVAAAIMQSWMQGPIDEFMMALLTGTSPGRAVFMAVIATVFVAVVALIATFQHLFLLRSHKQFPKP